MTCEESREILGALLDGEAGPDEATESSKHLITCGSCRDYRDQIALVRARLRAWPDESATGRRPWVTAPGTARRMAPWWMAAAAALVLLAAAGGFVAGRASAARHEAAPDAGAAVFIEDRRVVYPHRNEVHSEVILRRVDPAAMRIQ